MFGGVGLGRGSFTLTMGLTTKGLTTKVFSAAASSTFIASIASAPIDSWRGLRRSLQRGGLLVGLGLAAASCTPNRAVQCQRLSDIAQTVQETAQAGVSGRTPAIARAATGFTTAVQGLEQLDWLDEDLQVVQVALRNIYEGAGGATNQFLTALEARDRAQAEQAVRQLESLAQSEKEALNLLQSRCYPDPKTTDSPAPTSPPSPAVSPDVQTEVQTTPAPQPTAPPLSAKPEQPGAINSP